MTRAAGRVAAGAAVGLLLAAAAWPQFVRLGTASGQVQLVGATRQDDNRLVGIMALNDYIRSGTITASVHPNDHSEYLAEFKFPGLLPGTYTLVVTAGNYRLKAEQQIDMPVADSDFPLSPHPIRVILPSAPAAEGRPRVAFYIRLLRQDGGQANCAAPWAPPGGRVTYNGRPMPGVRVVVAAWSDATKSFQDLAEQTTGADGSYRMPFDAQQWNQSGRSEYFLTAQLKGFQPEIRTVARCDAPPADLALRPLAPEKRGILSTTMEAAYRFDYPPYLMNNLPVPGFRTFDYLALLSPGVLPPPTPWTRVGPGIAPGVGTPGQFVVNGLRGRENNFAMDGGDDNDEELGVRRQGFVAPAPQPMESVSEFQLVSAVPDARYGRSIAGQANAITASGAGAFHGGAAGWLTDNVFNARDYFTHHIAAGLPGPPLPVTLDGTPVPTVLPATGNSPFFRAQSSATLSGPIRKPANFFYLSYENFTTNARQESHFSVPSVAQRGVNGTGAAGFTSLQVYPFPTTFDPSAGLPQTAFTPATLPGNAVFSLFPFPNDVTGPYGPNTWTAELPADQHANQFAAKTDHRIGRKALSFRYNLNRESSDLPTDNGAIGSAIRPKVSSQGVAAYADIPMRSRVESSFRASFGDTSMAFDDLPGRSTLPSSLFPDVPFLLNAPLTLNVSQPGIAGARFVSASSATGKALLAAASVPSGATSETITGPLGALWIDGFSPVGVDTYHFPQTRNDRTFQFAHLTTAVRGRHTLKIGLDTRVIHLRSDNPRNERPYAVFNGMQGQSFFGPPSRYTSAASMAAMGVPGQLDQTLAGAPLPSLRLTSTQLDLFALDDIAITPRLRTQIGLRFGHSPLPYDEDQVILRNFDYSALQAQVQQAESSCLPACATLLQNVLSAFPGTYDDIFGAHPSSWDGRAGLVWDVSGRGSTVLRAGAGLYTGAFPALLVTESRSGFPWALPLDMANFPSYLGLNPVFVGTAVTRSAYLFNMANPAVRALDSRLAGAWQAGSLNLVNVPSLNGVPDTVSLLSGSLADAYPVLQPVQPQQGLNHPWSMQTSFSIEQRLSAADYLRVSFAGTQGRHLIRVVSPNRTPARSVLAYGGAVATYPLPQDAAAIPALPVFLGDLAPNPVGATALVNGIAVKPSVFQTSATSGYNSLQVDFRHRYSRRLVLGSAFTWSHAIDTASEIFNDLTGYSYPQDSAHPSERGSSDFDSRFRWVTHFVLDLPEVSRNWFWRDWRLSGVYTAQSGHPYTVVSSIDVNADGILNDRPDLASGIVPAHSSDPAARIAVAPNLTATQILASTPAGLFGNDGSVGRNSYVSWGMSNLDLALDRTIRLGSDQRSVTLRAEGFNILNRTQFAAPVAILEAPAFGNAASTLVPARRLQFGLRFRF